MIFLDGFWKYSFPPFVLMALAGLILLTVRTLRRQEEPIFAAIAVFALLMALWRIPVVGSARYTAVLSVPTILFSVYFLRTVPRLIRVNKIRRCWQIGVRIFIFALVVVCMVKALRPPREKKFLSAIPQTILKDQQTHAHRFPLILVLGSPGGVLDEMPGEVLRVPLTFDDAGKVVNPELLNARLDELHLEWQHWTHRVVYVILREPHESTFRSDFEARYRQKLILCYEDTMKGKSKPYRLYKLDPTWRQRWRSDRDLRRFFRAGNRLANGDFSASDRDYPTGGSVRELERRGFILNENAGGGWPAGWYVNAWAGWLDDALPAGVVRGRTPDGIACMQMYGQSTVSLWNRNKIPGGTRYYLLLDIDGDPLSLFQVFFLQGGRIRKNFIRVPSQRILLLQEVATDDGGTFDFALYLGHGRVRLYGVFLVPVREAESGCPLQK